MSLFRGALHAAPPRVALALTASAATGAALTVPLAALSWLVAAMLSLHEDPSPDGLLRASLLLGLISLPVWALGAAFLGLPTLLVLHRARLCGPVSLAIMVAGLGFLAGLALTSVEGYRLKDLIVLLPPPLLAGPVAGLVLHRVACRPRITDTGRIEALEETFR